MYILYAKWLITIRYNRAVAGACAFFEMNRGNTAADKDNFDQVMNIINAYDTNRNKKLGLLNKIKGILKIK